MRANDFFFYGVSFNRLIWAMLRLHFFTQLWCFGLPLFFISSMQWELQWMFKAHASYLSCLYEPSLKTFQLKIYLYFHFEISTCVTNFWFVCSGKGSPILTLLSLSRPPVQCRTGPAKQFHTKQWKIFGYCFPYCRPTAEAQKQMRPRRWPTVHWYFNNELG